MFWQSSPIKSYPNTKITFLTPNLTLIIRWGRGTAQDTDRQEVWVSKGHRGQGTRQWGRPTIHEVNRQKYGRQRTGQERRL